MPAAPSRVAHISASTPAGTSAIGLAWTLDPTCGWGNYGTQICIHGKTKKRIAIPLCGAKQDRLTNLQQSLLRANLRACRQIQQSVEQNAANHVKLEFPVLHAMNHHFKPSDQFQGTVNVGLVFFEGSSLSPAAVQSANEFDFVVAGSSWNASVLKQHGVRNVESIIQGIDPTLFHPAPATGAFRDRFVIFSGGKLEFRKGQDIVVAAFREFCKRHPDALLLTSWHNHWPRLMQTIGQKGYVTGPPQVAGKKLLLPQWLKQQGIPPRNVLDMGLVPNHMMASIIREANLAVFPNRCEGGTNLVAMESMACAVPCVIAANTGQLDLVGDQQHCFVLKEQHPIDSTPGFSGTEGWGESNVEELLSHLEWAYNHRDQLVEVGQRGHEFIGKWTWENQIHALCDVMEHRGTDHKHNG